MNRRQFAAACLAAPSHAASATRITRIRLAPVEGRFHKFVAMNSYDKAPKGHTYTNYLLRIGTDQGIEGLGMTVGAPGPGYLDELKPLLGADPLSLYVFESGRITGRAPRHEALLAKYPHLDGPLFDLIGKLKGAPCWKLMGGPARERVEVYDGTLYFSDVWFRDRGVRAVLEEAEESLKSGYLGMKFKLGRGAKWMETEAGLARDIEICLAVRKTAGPNPKILVDANNGYRNDFDRAWRLLGQTREARLHWMEEIFPEDIAMYTRLRANMEKAGMKTLIAEGETAFAPEDLTPFLKPRRLVDVLQLDIRRSGFVSNLRMARLGAEAGAVTVPHNWGSRAGLLMGLHLAKAVEAVVAAEDDRSTYDVVQDDGYRFRNGYYEVSDKPGLGIVVDEKAYEEKCRPRETAIPA